MKKIRILPWGRTGNSCAKFFKVTGLALMLFSFTGNNLFAESTNLQSVKEINQPDGKFLIKGVVVDAKGMPIPGVNVFEDANRMNGVITDMDGNYSLTVDSKNTILTFSFIGFEVQKVNVNGRTNVKVTLVEEVNDLDEVVVVGYGVQKKINLTGSVESVDFEKEMGERAATNVTTMLQGALPGLSVSMNESGGEPGATQKIRIRGAGTITGDGGTPYILVDGFPISMDQMNAINPNDIESVTVLKDAASAAIYGAKGAFGVILIKTKGGELNAKTTVNYSGKITYSAPTLIPDMANAVEFATAINQSLLNNGKPVFWNEKQLEVLQQQVDGKLEHETELNQWGKRWKTGREGFGNNDWYDIFYKDNAFGQEHNLSVSGGEKRTSYYFSGNFFEREGIFRYGDEKYERTNFQAKLNHKLNDWVSLQANTTYSKQEIIMPSGGFGGYDKDIIFHQIARTWPTNPFKDPDGNIIEPNVLRLINSGYNRKWVTNSTYQFGATFEPIKNWETKLSYNWQDNGIKNHREEFENEFINPDGSISNIGYAPNAIKKWYTFSKNEMFNVTTSYTKKINKHNFAILAGYEQREEDSNRIHASRNEMLTQSIPSISTSVGEDNVDDLLTSSSTRGIFGRFSYNYREVYLLELNGRYDGSSYFAEDNRWGFFPSVSLGYNISRENFWQSIEPYITSMKFKLSYGELGNHDAKLASLYSERMQNKLSQWLINGEQAVVIAAPTVVSPNLTWETVATTNFGIEAGFLKNQLRVSFDAFKRVTSDMIGPTGELPAVLGAVPPKENNAEWTTKGWEVKINYRNKIGEFGYRVSLSLDDAKTEITDYYNPTGILTDWRNGQEVGEIWGYQTVGFFESDEAAAKAPSQKLIYSKWTKGDTQYADLDKSGAIDYGANTVDNHGDLCVIGNQTPRYNYGINLGANYKGFDLSLLFQGVGKRDYVFAKNTALFYGFRGNQWQNCITKESLDYWTEDNTDAYFPKPYFTNEQLKNTEKQSKYVQDASYIRLKNVQLSYTLPEKWTKKFNVRVYYSGENLWLHTDLNENFDPETLAGTYGSGKLYPINKVHSFGVNVKF